MNTLNAITKKTLVKWITNRQHVAKQASQPTFTAPLYKHSSPNSEQVEKITLSCSCEKGIKSLCSHQYIGLWFWYFRQKQLYQILQLTLASKTKNANSHTLFFLGGCFCFVARQWPSSRPVSFNCQWCFLLWFSELKTQVNGLTV